MVRVPTIDADSLPEDYQYLLEHPDAAQNVLFQASGNNPPILQSYMRWLSTLWEESGLPDSDLEFVILTVANRLESRYEWHQHVPLALEAGLPEEEIRAIHRGEMDSLDGRRASLYTYVNEFITGTVDDSDHDLLADQFEDDTVVGVVWVAGTYVATARVIAALDIPLEEPFVGWELENR